MALAAPRLMTAHRRRVLPEHGQGTVDAGCVLRSAAYAPTSASRTRSSACRTRWTADSVVTSCSLGTRATVAALQRAVPDHPDASAWDTSNGSNNAGCSTETLGVSRDATGPDACSAVFNYLSGLQINNTLWEWADGPYRADHATTRTAADDGNYVQVANADYSGPVKARAVQRIDYKPSTENVGTEISQLQSNKLDFGVAETDDLSKSPGPGMAGHNLAAAHGRLRPRGQHHLRRLLLDVQLRQRTLVVPHQGTAADVGEAQQPCSTSVRRCRSR